jgi:integrase
VNRSTQLLSQAYKLAVHRGDLASAPYVMKLSEAGNARQGFFTEQEFRNVLDNLPSYLQDFILFCYLVGWRSGEVKSLRWEDTEGDSLIRLRDVNSKNGVARSVSVVGPRLRELFERRKRARSVKTPSGAVVMSEFIFHKNGAPVGDFRKAWKTACNLAGVPGRLPHDLRRCCVRNLVRSGVPTDVARQITGHLTAAVFSRYNIVAEEQKADALVTMEAYLANEQPKTVAMQAHAIQ